MQEIDLWKHLMGGTLLASFFSLFQGSDVEVYWPLLLCYFIIMTCFLCRFKIEHMIRHKYVPFEFGKKKY